MNVLVVWLEVVLFLPLELPQLTDAVNWLNRALLTTRLIRGRVQANELAIMPRPGSTPDHIARKTPEPGSNQY